MKILVFAHSEAPGGAENALRHLVRMLVAQGHYVEVMLPSAEHGESAWYQSQGIQCHVLGALWSLPAFSSALLNLSVNDFSHVADLLKREQFDLALSNTIAIIHGAVIASLMGIPHVFYAHEYLEDDELLPDSISARSYLDIVADCSAGILACSNFVASQFPASSHDQIAVLEPYDYALAPLERVYRRDAECVLQIIGVRSLRKNPQFAVTVASALKLRGRAVRLDFAGAKKAASHRLERALFKSGLKYRMSEHVADPYVASADARVVTLVCANCEPYGLVIPESLRRAIPVVSARSGGPQEMLPDALLYECGNLDRCVRLVEHAFERYDEHVAQAHELYRSLSARKTAAQIASETSQFLERIASTGKATAHSRLDALLARVATLVRPAADIDTIARNIATVAMRQGIDWSAAKVGELIREEKAHPGTAVLADLKRFDAVPFCMSPQMDRLKREGLGIAIELACALDDATRWRTAAFIVCALDEMQRRLGRPPKVLVQGDAIGIETLRIAASGFDVDWLDSERQAVTDIARLNFEEKRDERAGGVIRIVGDAASAYDAVISLESNEPEPDPQQFAATLSRYLADGGSLFISDRFSGTENARPTGLYTSDRYAGAFPFLLAHGLEFAGVNKAPFGKPFVFVKRSDGNGTSWEELVHRRSLVEHLVGGQLDIGV